MRRGENRSDATAEKSSENKQGAAVLTVEQPGGAEPTASRAASQDAAALAPPRSEIPGIRLATLVALSEAGTAMLLLPEAGEASGVVPGRSTVVLRRADIGRQVAVMFEGGDPERPIVIGLIEAPGSREEDAIASGPGGENEESVLEIDVERLLLTAKREIVLRCGEASVTLTRSGKVLIRGTKVLSRASGVNRIKGGSVQIN